MPLILIFSVFQRLFELGCLFIKGVDVIDNASLFGEGREDDGVVLDFAGVEVASGAFA